MPISADQARRIAEAELRRIAAESTLDLVLHPDHPDEVPEGWLFTFTSRRWRDGDAGAALAGNGPLFVSRDGELHQLWTGEPWQRQLDRFRETGSITPPI